MTVDLPQEMWQNILALLAKHPYEMSAQLIHGISNQLREQSKPNGQMIPNVDTRPGV